MVDETYPHDEIHHGDRTTTTTTTTTTETTTKKSGSSEPSSSKPIDNAALAAMLRESADFVQKGEFDPILYQTLIDFRTYYKKHLPKKKEKGSSSGGGEERTKKKRSKKKSSSHNSTKQAPSSSSSDNNKLKNDNNVDGPSMTSADDTTLNNNNNDAASTEPFTPIGENSDMGNGGDDNINDTKHVSDDESSKGTAPAETSKEFTTAPPAPPVPPAHAPAPAPNPVTSPLRARMGKYIPVGGERIGSPSRNSTVQKAHLPTAMFGTFKLPNFLHNPMPNTSAFDRTSKKNAQRAKVDLEEFVATDLAKQAEASRRRKVADGEPPSSSSAVSNLDSSSSAMHHNQEGATTTDEGSTNDVYTTGYANNSRNPTTAAANDDSSFITRDSIESSTRSATQPAEQQENSNAPSATTTQTKTFDTTPVANGDTTTAASGRRRSDSPGSDNMQPQQTKPAFQRPVNKSSSLVANGWIEQQRRSKMRFVWKEVLASLVHGKNPGEETTLWIQREVINPSSGKRELEALHQIPVRLLQKVSFLDYTMDNQFTLQLFNQMDEFSFRCSDHISAMNWVSTLKKFEEEAKGISGQSKDPPAAQKSSNEAPYDEEKKGTDTDIPQQQQPPESSSDRLTIRELRATCHGAGINTAGMERAELEAAADKVRQRGTYFAPPVGVNFPNIPMGGAPPTTTTGRAQASQSPTPDIQLTRQYPPEAHPARTSPVPPADEPATQPHPTQNGQAKEAPKKLSVKELRAICHGAGINTAGMERGELQAAADSVLKRGTYFEPPPGQFSMPTAASASASADEQRKRQDELQREEAVRVAKEELQREEELRARQEELRKQEELRARQEELRKQEELRARQEELRKQEELRARQEELRKQEELRARQEELRKQEELRARQEEMRRQEQIRAQQEEIRRKQEQELLRRREEEARRRQMEEEQRRRAAEQQAAAEQQRRYAEQQAAWQRQQQEEMQRRQAAEQHAAEQRRRHEEAIRNQQRWAGQQAQQQQQWNQQQQQAHHQQQWQQQQHPHQQQQNWQQQQHPHQQQQNWQQQQAHHQQRHQTPPPQQHYQQQQQHPQNNERHSAADDKYAKMANQTEDDGQATITRIKHDILIHWALQPPQLCMLKPVDVLVTTIHSVFPPALGVPAHDYFKKWNAIDRNGLFGGSGQPDEDKLKKAVRKVRFFLHPDKLPKDLNPEQQFMVKMLWDVTSDAWEEFEKSREALDWIK